MFEAGAMPALRELSFMFDEDEWDQAAPGGLHHLPSLEKITIFTAIYLCNNWRPPKATGRKKIKKPARDALIGSVFPSDDALISSVFQVAVVAHPKCPAVVSPPDLCLSQQIISDIYVPSVPNLVILLQEDVAIMGTRLPFLVALSLRIPGVPALKCFRLDYDGMSCLMFEAGAMPALRELTVIIDEDEWDQAAPGGLHHLPNPTLRRSQCVRRATSVLEHDGGPRQLMKAVYLARAAHTA
ncbi:hypothetical protein HU200_028359 [Digitaria exilis]|uniref:Uncharacterized protein n=1 Tax=Digitaria exilis TaxID=1010633 RepID=A0A835ESG4_9POAL|nr:hypothetical protein HU200_028359 [Digitaria exilis]